MNDYEALSLNEVFVGEKDVAKSGIFRIKIDDDVYLGQFFSSGLLISTGTGSTGWLTSAMQFTEQNVSSVLEILGHHLEPAEVRSHLASSLSSETAFAPHAQKMFYYVREPTAADISGQYEGFAQGFCTHLEFISDLNNGRVSIDGMHSIDIGLGDSFTLDAGEEHVLKGIKFIL